MKQKTAYLTAILALIAVTADFSVALPTATPPITTTVAPAPAPAPTVTPTTTVVPVVTPKSLGKRTNKPAKSSFSAMSQAPAGQCSGDIADALVRGTSGIDVNQVREALRGFGDRVSIGTCNANMTEYQGLLGYQKVSARENFAKALIAAYASLKGKGQYSSQDFVAAWNKALADLGVSATAEILASKCQILKI